MSWRRSIGFDDINMDVIAALPGEDYAMFALHAGGVSARLRPESLTVHTLAIKRSSRLHEEKYAQAEQDVRSHGRALGRQTAHDMGMRAYYLYRQKYMAENLENVGYARAGAFLPIQHRQHGRNHQHVWRSARAEFQNVSCANRKRSCAHRI